MELNQVVQGFDSLASVYDAHFSAENNPQLARHRAQNIERLSSMYPPGSWVLDVGCGAGEEAVALATQGCRGWAGEPSEGMLALARARASEAGVEAQISFHQLKASEIASLLGEIPAERLAGAYASFGVVNLEPDLAGFRDGLFQLVRPSGRIAISALNSNCVFERVYGTTHGRFGLARRRHQAPASMVIPGPDGPQTIPVRFLDAQALVDQLKPAFSVDKVVALNLLTPPLEQGDVYQRHKGLFKVLGALEASMLETVYAIRYSDHYLLTMFRENEELAGRPHGPHWLANG